MDFAGRRVYDRRGLRGLLPIGLFIMIVRYSRDSIAVYNRCQEENRDSYTIVNNYQNGTVSGLSQSFLTFFWRLLAALSLFAFAVFSPRFIRTRLPGELFSES